MGTETRAKMANAVTTRILSELAKKSIAVARQKKLSFKCNPTTITLKVGKETLTFETGNEVTLMQKRSDQQPTPDTWSLLVTDPQGKTHTLRYNRGTLTLVTS